MVIDITDIHGKLETVSDLTISKLLDSHSLTSNLINYKDGNMLFDLDKYIDAQFCRKVFANFIRYDDDNLDISQETIINGIGRLNIFLIMMLWTSKMLGKLVYNKSDITFRGRKWNIVNIEFSSENTIEFTLYLSKSGSRPKDNYIRFWVSDHITQLRFDENTCEDSKTVFDFANYVSLAFSSRAETRKTLRMGDGRFRNLTALKKDLDFVLS